MARKANDEWRNVAERRAAEEFGTWLAERRSHLTQVQLAEQAGVSTSLIANVEAGRRRATDNFLDSVAGPMDSRAHRLGAWHLKAMREKFLAEELLSAILRLPDVRDALTQRVAVEPHTQALIAEAVTCGQRAEVFKQVVLAWLAAVGRQGDEDFDPQKVREVVLNNVDTEAVYQEIANRVLSDEIALVGGQESQRVAARPERERLLDELNRDLGRLSTPQLLRVIGYVASLSHGSPRDAVDTAGALDTGN